MILLSFYWIFSSNSGNSGCSWYSAFYVYNAMFRKPLASCYHTELPCFSSSNFQLLPHIRHWGVVAVKGSFSMKTDALFLPVRTRQKSEHTSTVFTNLNFSFFFPYWTTQTFIFYFILIFIIIIFFGIAVQVMLTFHFSRNAQTEM